MDLQQRSKLLRRRFKALSASAAPVAVESARGLVRAKLPPGPPSRRGVTGPVTGLPAYSSLGPAFAEFRRLKWMETPGVPKKDFGLVAPPQRREVSPLIRIAAQYPEKPPRNGVSV